MPEFRFHSISLEQIDRFSPNFIYAFILTISRLGLLHIIFRTFVLELGLNEMYVWFLLPTYPIFFKTLPHLPYPKH